MMTIAECATARDQLGQQITALIREFEARSGALVGSVYLLHGTGEHGRRETIAARPEVTLP